MQNRNWRREFSLNSTLQSFFFFKTRDPSQKQTRFWNTYTPMTHGLWSVADKTRKNPLVSCMVVWRIWGDSAREKNCVSMASTRRILIMKPRSHDRLYHHHHRVATHLHTQNSCHSRERKIRMDLDDIFVCCSKRPPGHFLRTANFFARTSSRPEVD